MLKFSHGGQWEQTPSRNLYETSASMVLDRQIEQRVYERYGYPEGNR